MASKEILNTQWLLAKRPVNRSVEKNDFVLNQATVPDLQTGQFLIKVMYLSLAPVMRFYMLDGASIEKPLDIGEVMRGRGVGIIIKSRNRQYSVGDVVHGKMGWQEYSIADGSSYFLMFKVGQRSVPFSTALGVLGLTGFTAYFGLLDIGRPKASDTVLVSGAAGGVGSSVGQIAKILGCRTVGIAGTAMKCNILTADLGYDAAINYREHNLDEKIAEFCPNGVDIYFDNVGGEVLDAGLAHINPYARVVSCGQISQYIGGSSPKPLFNAHKIGRLNATMQGFLIYDYQSRFDEAEIRMTAWVKAGQLKYKEDILRGIEAMPEALIRLYDGLNAGKQLVEVNPNTDIACSNL